MSGILSKDLVPNLTLPNQVVELTPILPKESSSNVESEVVSAEELPVREKKASVPGVGLDHLLPNQEQEGQQYRDPRGEKKSGPG